MDPEKAKVLFNEGAILLLLNMPAGTEFGIDYNSWSVGPNFRGVKMIPPGVHFVYYSAVNSDGEVSPRTGFFYDFCKREMVVRKWDRQLEDVVAEDTSAEDMERYASNKQDMDRFLGPYPYENYKKWVSLTNHITPAIVYQLQPTDGKISAVTQFVSEVSTSASRRMEALAGGGGSRCDKQGLPEMAVKASSVIRYSKLPEQKYPNGASPSEITKYSMDSSYALQTVLAARYQEEVKGILGEIQFAFICFLMGQTYDSFEQWKKLIHLLCTSEEAVTQHPDLYLDFISMLHFQLREVPPDLFVDIVASNNFLTQTLQEFFSNIENNSVPHKLNKRALSFRDHLTQKFKWDFSSEPDDYAPVVVNMTE